MNENDKKIKSLISDGTEIAGGAAGAALGFFAGDPATAVGASVAGFLLTRVLRDMTTRFLSGRETTRVGATAAIAIASIGERLHNGERLRGDTFFEPRGNRVSSAEEIFEGALLAAKNTHEEKKALYLGRLFSNVAFDSSCLEDEANYLLHVAESLTYSQFILLHLFSGKAGEYSLRTTEYGSGAQVQYATISLLHSIHELCDLNLVIKQDPGESNYTFVMGTNIICPSHLKLAVGGDRLHNLLGLSAIPKEDVENVAQWLR